MPTSASRIDYVKEIEKERALRIVRTKKSSSSQTNAKGCWLFTGSNNTDGYGQVFVKPNSKLHMKGRSAQQALLLHILSYLSLRSSDFDTKHHISHLCSNRSCFNPEHLVAEDARQNNSRKGCPGNISCSECGKPAYSCPHQPNCIV